jgi:hypothetical protein
MEAGEILPVAGPRFQQTAQHLREGYPLEVLISSLMGSRGDVSPALQHNFLPAFCDYVIRMEKTEA